MLFVIEGCDLTGKTVLARHLQVVTGATYIHSSRPARHPLEEYELAVAAHRNLDHLVLDRWHLGELVWPEIFGRSTQFDQAMCLHVELLLRSRGAVLVRASRAYNSLAEAITCHPDEPITAVDLPRIYDLFGVAFAQAQCPIFDWNFEENSNPQALLELGGSYQLNVAKVNMITREWIGHPRPSVLLVGERFGASHPESAQVPFVPYRDTSGYFLMQELLDSDLTKVAICNTYRSDGEPEQLHELWEALGAPPVVALGREAEKALLGHPCCGAVPHPQYSRRFERARGPGAYGDRIIEAANLRR